MNSYNDEVFKQKYLKYKEKYLHLKMEHYNDQVAGSLQNKKMLIFTDVTTSIMTDDKKNLLKSA
jgi:hypothetical protein